MKPPDDFGILDLLPDPIQIVDPDGHIVFMNEKMRAGFGDLTGRICYQAIKKSGTECGQCPRKRLDRTAFRDQQVEIEAVNGRNFLVNHSTMFIGGEPHVIETYKDITEYKRLLQEDALVKAEVGVAWEIQKRCITVEQDVPGFAIRYRYQPAHVIAGDFLNLHRWDDRFLAVAVADVTGHGIGAAAVTFMLKTVYDHLCRERLTLNDFMLEMRRRLQGYLIPGHFVTMAIVMLDRETMTGSIVNAGHPPVLHRARGSDGLRLYKAQMPPIGIDAPGTAALGEERFTVAPGDRLIFYSDGIYQQFQRSFGAFRDEVTRLADAPAAAMMAALLPPAEVPLEDDVTLLLLEALASPAPRIASPPSSMLS